MKTFQLLPVGNGQTLQRRESVAIEIVTDGATQVELWLGPGGQLVPQRRVHATAAGAEAAPENHRFVGFLYPSQAGDSGCYLVTADCGLGVNCTSPPLAVAWLEPGDLLSIDDQFWMAARLWKPEAVPAPASLADRPCPVCGLPFSAAPVVECVCGRWTHLERPDAPDDKNALNCFLAAGICGSCQIPTDLMLRSIPAVPDRLLAYVDDWYPADDPCRVEAEEVAA